MTQDKKENYLPLSDTYYKRKKQRFYHNDG